MKLNKNTYLFLKSKFEYILLIIFIGFIVYATRRIICEYLATFRNMPRSTDPAAWGQLGDYIGGLLNPTLSAATLVFVAMTYLTQKREIRRLTRAAEESDKIRKKEEIFQNLIYEKRDREQSFNAMIASKYKDIDFLYSEIRRASEHLNVQKGLNNVLYNFTNMDDKEMRDENEIRHYIKMQMIKIRETQTEIHTIINRLDSLNKQT